MNNSVECDNSNKQIIGSISYLLYFVFETLTILSKEVNKLIAWAQCIARTQEMPGCMSHKPGHGLQIPLLVPTMGSA